MAAIFAANSRMRARRAATPSGEQSFGARSPGMSAVKRAIFQSLLYGVLDGQALRCGDAHGQSFGFPGEAYHEHQIA